MDWLRGLSSKVKIIIGAIGFFIGLALFVIIKKKFLAKDKLNYELSKISHEIEIANLEKDFSAKENKLKILNESKDEILRKIDIIEAQEVEIGREMSVEELEGFFDSRGF